MAHINVEAMRQSHDAYRQAIRDLEGDSASVKVAPVAEWGDRRYVVTGTIRLVEGMQRLEVIDITDRPDVALIGHIWPDQGTRTHALVIDPDEGHTSIVVESGYTPWVRYADLPIHVMPGTREDLREVVSQQLQELDDADGYGLSQGY